MYIVLTDKNDIYDDGNKYDPEDHTKFRCKTGINATNQIVLNNTRKIILDLSSMTIEKILIKPYIPIKNIVYIRILSIPNNDNEILEWFHNGYIIPDKMILSDRYYIFDPKTIKKFRITINKNYIDLATKQGDINILDRLVKYNVDMNYFRDGLDILSSYGYVNVMNWWIKSNLPIKYSEKAIYSASINGHISVLEWWYKSNLPLKYYNNILEEVAYRGRIDVLEWWLDKNLPITGFEYHPLLYYLEDHYKINVNVREWYHKDNKWKRFNR